MAAKKKKKKVQKKTKKSQKKTTKKKSGKSSSKVNLGLKQHNKAKKDLEKLKNSVEELKSKKLMSKLISLDVIDKNDVESIDIVFNNSSIQESLIKELDRAEKANKSSFLIKAHLQGVLQRLKLAELGVKFSDKTNSKSKKTDGDRPVITEDSPRGGPPQPKVSWTANSTNDEVNNDEAKNPFQDRIKEILKEINVPLTTNVDKILSEYNEEKNALKDTTPLDRTRSNVGNFVTKQKQGDSAVEAEMAGKPELQTAEEMLSSYEEMVGKATTDYLKAKRALYVAKATLENVYNDSIEKSVFDDPLVGVNGKL